MAKSNVTVYACGGCGSNIVNGGLPGFEATYDLFSAPAEKRMDIHYLDTSKSNQIDREGFDSLHLFGENLGVDGAGGMRGNLKDLIRREIKGVLAKMVPGEMNLVVFSTGGGSGSVIGPVLIAELKAMQRNVIALCVTGVGATNTLKNTKETYAGLEIYSQRATPITCMIFDNEPSAASWPKINSEVHRAITQIWSLYSGAIDGLDKADITSFLNFHERFGKRKSLARLQVFDGVVERESEESALGVIRLFQKGQEIENYQDVPTDFGLDGFVTKRLRLPNSIYYVLDYVGHQYVDKLMDEYERATQATAVSSTHRNFATDIKVDDDDFLIV